MIKIMFNICSVIVKRQNCDRYIKNIIPYIYVCVYMYACIYIYDTEDEKYSSDDHAYLGSKIPTNSQLFQIREVYKYFNLFIQSIS